MNITREFRIAAFEKANKEPDNFHDVKSFEIGDEKKYMDMRKRQLKILYSMLQSQKSITEDPESLEWVEKSYERTIQLGPRTGTPGLDPAKYWFDGDERLVAFDVLKKSGGSKQLEQYITVMVQIFHAAVTFQHQAKVGASYYVQEIEDLPIGASSPK
jgi:hypothetical protein